MIFRSKKSLEKFYKFKALKVYASTEWLADGKKKYRTVFEGGECTYLYVELSFYNKLFDDENWEVKVNLKCYRLLDKSKREELCDLPVQAKISKEDNVVFIREGWGNKEAGFWTRGDYVWEAYMGDELVGVKYFYIEEGGEVSADDNPYFELKQLNLYEGPNEGKPIFDRKYYTHFDSKDTRYVWGELHLENMQGSAWYCELFFYFYNSAGQLKGHTTELKRVENDDNDVIITTGWGSDTRGSWHRNKYTLEVIFMDKLVAVVPFEIGEDYVEGNSVMLTGDALNTPHLQRPLVIHESLEDLLAELDELIGLQSVKNRVRDYVNYLKFIQLRKKNGFNEEQRINLHAVFKGNPGTGKTTVANMLGKIYYKMGLLSNGKVTEVGRAELIGQYIGQTAPKVKEMIDRARGGILFIDEAYALVRNKEDNKDYGQEVIEILVKEMSDGEGDLAIVMAGYPKEMDVLLDSNPGLKSRFSLYFDFPDFLPQELRQITHLALKTNELIFEEQALHIFNKKIVEKYRRRDETFGNARLVNNLVQEVKLAMSQRLMQTPTPDLLEKEHLELAKKEDVEKAFAKEAKQRPILDIDEELLVEAYAELEEMIGLREVKKQVKELTSLVRFYKETGKDVLNQFSLHTVFKGNPGTGKTTVARILAKIYQALGILERGHLVECSRENLVAGFVGQTAIKTQEKINEALGGILFIDEAYALNSLEGSNDFGREALEVIIKQMEDRRGELLIIAAGYSNNMDRFLEMNPGLKSRFDKIFNFEDFRAEELYEICSNMLEQQKLQPDPAAEDRLKRYFQMLYDRRDKFFGNGRAIRKIIDDAIRNQNLRMANLDIAERNEEALRMLTMEDIADLEKHLEEHIGKNHLGFKKTQY